MMHNNYNLSSIILDEIVQKCINLYLNLPKSGKPSDCEWTVLSCIIQYNKETTQYEIVSLGTGSKCIGASKMSPEGYILNDSHAEVLARRGFLLYLYRNILKLFSYNSNNESIFRRDKENFVLKEEIQFLFYSSQMPCGDASIMPKDQEDGSIGDVLCNKKRKLDPACDIDAKKVKIDEDVHRTGAKCLPNSDQDPKLSGKDYHVLGQVRTKPGRGERTLSVSCSDKIARWIHVGLQGALLDLLLLEPIYIKYFIFGAGSPYSEDTLKRAFYNRNNDEVIPKCVPVLYNSSIKFVHLRDDFRIRPASGSIIWINVSPRLSEVAVQGTKLGVTKKKANLCKGLCMSKYNVYKQFIEVLDKCPELKYSICGEDNIKTISYNEMKQKSVRYKENWLRVKDKFFKNWTVKPDIWRFCVND